jgi:hypothetical protein
MKRKCFYFGFLVLSVLLFSLSGCAALSPSTLRSQGANENLLPPLTPVLDVHSFGSVFPIQTTTGGGTVTVPVGTTGYSISSTVPRQTFSSWELNELSIMFAHEVENNISAPLYTGEVKGAIMVRLATGENDLWRHMWMPVVSGLTLMTVNLFGFPLGAHTIGFQIEVSIHDNTGNIIGKYTSDYHAETSYAAFYWGYKPRDIAKRSLRLVYTECMTDIKRQIANDYDRLITALR